MTDDPFESRLDHLFAVVDEPADALAFRQALAARLRRDRLVRSCAMLGAGLLGAAVAAVAALPVLALAGLVSVSSGWLGPEG